MLDGLAKTMPSYKEPLKLQFLRRETVYVISDLHLGGQEGMQICRARNTQLLTKFILSVIERHKQSTIPVHLILNGDVVDFLAEPYDGRYEAFTASEVASCSKLMRIMNEDTDCKRVFDALAVLASLDNARLTILIGNHDIELSFPTVRRELFERIGNRRVEIIYDNESLSMGSLLIEHGNRYDSWNYIDHDKLRAYRSLLSRNDRRARFDPPPGSALVVDVINKLKQIYPFIDLLKPEDEATLPLLRALAKPSAKTLRAKRDAVHKWLAKIARQSVDALAQGRGGNLSARTETSPRLNTDDLEMEEPDYQIDLSASSEDELQPQLALEALKRIEQTEKLLEEMDDLDPNASQLGMLDWVEATLRILTADFRNEKHKVTNLHKALKSYHRWNPNLLDVNTEKDQYLNSAEHSAENGFKVIVYGHTHLMKRVKLRNGLYINTGTWADLMFLPSSVYDTEPTDKHPDILAFIDALRSKTSTAIDSYRRQLPSYVTIELSPGGECEPSSVRLHLFKEEGAHPEVIKGSISSL